jgi:hypothetical protein
MQFTVIDEIKNLLTTTSLILDRINSTGRPPIGGQRQLLVGPESVALAGVLGLHDPPLRVSPGAQVDGAVLLTNPTRVCESFQREERDKRVVTREEIHT